MARLCGMPSAVLTILAAIAALPAMAVAAEVELADAVRQLASADPRDRQEARQQLLQAELEELSAVAEAARDLDRRQRALPELRQTLEEVVRQVVHRRAKQRFMTSGEARFSRVQPLAFFGIQLVSSDLNARMLPSQTGPGITVAHAMTGFRAYEYFEEGDVVLAARLEVGRAFEPIFNLISLSDVLESVDVEQLMNFRDSVVLEVLTLRAGRIESIPFRLDVRIDTEDPAFARAQQQAAEQARSLWERDFLPVFAGPEPQS